MKLIDNIMRELILRRMLGWAFIGALILCIALASIVFVLVSN